MFWYHQKEAQKLPAISGSVVRRSLRVGMHQILAIFGVIVWAGMLTAIAIVDISKMRGRVAHLSDVHRALSAAPFFPIEVVVGLLLGWLVWKQFQDRVMFWVWVFPLVPLLMIMLEDSTHVSTIYPGATVTNYKIMLSTYFGSGCHVDEGCFKQIEFTVPFYAAVSYAIGAWFGWRFPIRSRPLGKFLSGTVVTLGIFVFADTIQGLTEYVGRTSMWLISVAGIIQASMGTWLIYIGLRMRSMSNQIGIRPQSPDRAASPASEQI
jgi:hypothetical protein